MAILDIRLRELLAKFTLTFYTFSQKNKSLVEEMDEAAQKTIFSPVQQALSNYSNKGGLPINVVFVPIKCIQGVKSYFYDAVIRAIHERKGGKQMTDKNYREPVLFIGYYNIMEEGQVKKIQEEESIMLDPRFRFLDSSIWYRYVGMEGSTKDGDSFEERLSQALQSIEWAYANQLYCSNVSREFVEFSNRLIRNSYLQGGFGGGHASQVFPFTFHSETYMQKKARQTFKEIRALKLHWNFLLIDDFAGHILKGDDFYNYGKKVNKDEIIRLMIKNFHCPDSDQYSVCTHFNTERNIEEAKNRLIKDATIEENSNGDEINQNIIYDIILLDFLFSKKLKDQTGETSYGTKLLEVLSKTEIEDRKELYKAKAPCKLLDLPSYCFSRGYAFYLSREKSPASG